MTNTDATTEATPATEAVLADVKPTAATKTPTTYEDATDVPPTITRQWTPKTDPKYHGLYAVCFGPAGAAFVVALDTKKNVAHAEDVAAREGWNVTFVPDVRLVEVAAKKTAVAKLTPAQVAFLRPLFDADPVGFAATFPTEAAVFAAEDADADEADA